MWRYFLILFLFLFVVILFPSSFPELGRFRSRLFLATDDFLTTISAISEESSLDNQLPIPQKWRDISVNKTLPEKKGVKKTRKNPRGGVNKSRFFPLFIDIFRKRPQCARNCQDGYHKRYS